MKISEYISYFQTAAVNHKVLADTPNHRTFYAIDIQDVENAMKLSVKDACMLLECYSAQPFDGLSDNIRKLQTGAFAIIKEAKINDSASREAALLETEEICEDIISKMMNDYRKSRQNNLYLPKINLELNSIRIHKVGPILTNHYGWRVEFQLNNKFTRNLQLDPLKWNNETKF